MHKPHKNETVVAFGNLSTSDRPFIRFKGVNVKRIHPTCYRIKRTHVTQSDGLSFIACNRLSVSPLTVAFHPADLFPGDDDAATRTELQRRIAEWESADPKRAAAWRAAQERQRAAARQITRELNKMLYGIS